MATTTNTTNAVSLVNERKPIDWLRWLSVILAIIGLGISAYITITSLMNVETICLETGGFNCSLVQGSIYSRVGPIPVQYLGVAGYLGILLVLLLENRIPFLQARGRMVVFGLTLGGFLFSLYLTAIEAFVLNAWCVWCVISAIAMTLLFAISFARMWQQISAVPDEDDAEA
jgi:uncharacterized membrane protein